MSNSPAFKFDNSYARRSEDFYASVDPTPVKSPSLIKFNPALAEQLGINVSALSDQHLAELFSGNELAEGSEPIAMAYCGHQFGNLNPQLGDGRAILLGEVIAKDGLRYDIQLKGPGRTPFSRNGDGRAALGPILREYLLSESMHVLGVPTTRALAAVSTGEMVRREQLLPGAIITRVAHGFVRVGTFQYFAIRGKIDDTRKLADYVIDRNYPELKATETPYLSLLESVIEQQAKLIAKWMQLGFIHGVMNTDNMSVSGETIDYGPCAFIDEFHPTKVFSSIDRQGRYAYQNQPAAGHWDLCRFAEALVPLLDEDQETAGEKAQQAINTFPKHYEHYWLTGMAQKLGLSAPTEADRGLINALLDCMAENKADFTLTFYHLSNALAESTENDGAIRHLFSNPESFDDWAKTWRKRLSTEQTSDEARQIAMHAVNPLYIPRNHLVEAVIRAAEDRGDYQPFYELLEVLQQPYTEQPRRGRLAEPPKPEEVVLNTFCGT